MSASARASDYLLEYFGFAEFRNGQAEIIDSIMAGRDSIVVMPTGGGKSLCYQLPAIMLGGVTVVVSPLIALMKDQVDALSARGIRATFINSSLRYADLVDRLSGVRNGVFNIVYVAPERFRNQAFTSAIAESAVRLFAVDEAHCISHWGHDFRPDYLRLSEAVKALGRPPIIALTATATGKVRSDIAQRLQLKEPGIFVAGFDRPNLRLRVAHIGGDKEKLLAVKEIVSTSQGSGIIYAATRKSVETISAKLKMAGFSIEAYHAGMTEKERTIFQDRFMSGEARAIVATNAFGMGIDKHDIRFVVHYHLPGSIEAYYQEIGRAGRDGAAADCVLLFNYGDTRTHRFFIEGNHPTPDLINSVYRSLCRLAGEGNDIRAREIQSHLGIKNEMAVQTALTVLERGGSVERGIQTDTVVKTALATSLDAGLGATSPTSAEGILLRHLVYTHDVNQGEFVEIDLAGIPRETGLDPARVRGALNNLVLRGIVASQNAYRGLGFRPIGGAGGRLSLDREDLAARATAQQVKLRSMVDYCYSKRCLRMFLLNYFGEEYTRPECGSCSACAPGSAEPALERRGRLKHQGGTLRLATERPAAPSTLNIGRDEPADGQPVTPRTPRSALDSGSASAGIGTRNAETAATRSDSLDEDTLPDVNKASGGIDAARIFMVKNILGCVARLDGRFGKGTIVCVLTGSISKEVATHSLHRLPTYGVLSHTPAQEVAGFIKSLIKAGCIAVSNAAYPTLSITDFGREVMQGSVRVCLDAPRPPHIPAGQRPD